ncbi:MAG: class I SAM-dependent methyltransferase [Armatimonadetes bacterium]|nr:class I SAM-dependent methyltransferase [Armatimonadota bacterium]
MPADSYGWAGSAAAWVEFVDATDPNRAYVLDPAMAEKAGDVRGLRALDVGCGEGRFCRLLSERGAATVGVDPTPALLEVARDRHPEGEYVEARAEQLPFEDASFDLAVSYVTLCDIPDYRRAISEMARVLKGGGRLLAAIHTPFVTTSPTGWLRDENGAKTIFPVDCYTFESGTKVSWRGIEVVNYHRPQAGYMRAFLAAGLILADYAEPLPDADAIAACPEVADYLRVPVFTVMEWAKP